MNMMKKDLTLKQNNWKKGDILVCITNISTAYPPLVMDYLIEGKHYEVEGEDNFAYTVPVIKIKDEMGVINGYDQRYFLSIVDYRKLKLNKICSKLVI